MNSERRRLVSASAALAVAVAAGYAWLAWPGSWVSAWWAVIVWAFLPGFAVLAALALAGRWPHARVAAAGAWLGGGLAIAAPVAGQGLQLGFLQIMFTGLVLFPPWFAFASVLWAGTPPGAQRAVARILAAAMVYLPLSAQLIRTGFSGERTEPHADGLFFVASVGLTLFALLSLAAILGPRSAQVARRPSAAS